MEIDPRDAEERLDRRGRHKRRGYGDPPASLAKNLGGVRHSPIRPLVEAGERHNAIEAVMIVGVEGAAAQLQRVEAGAAVEPDIGGGDVSGRTARRVRDVRIGVAAGDAKAITTIQRRIGAEDKTADMLPTVAELPFPPRWPQESKPCAQAE